MKAYIILFFILIFTIIIVFTLTGINSIRQAFDYQNLIPVNEWLKTANSNLKEIYSGLPDGDDKNLIEETSGLLDSAQSYTARFDVFKQHSFNIIFINIVFAGLICLLAGFFLWLGTYRLFIRPIYRITKAMAKASEGHLGLVLKPAGVKEIKSLTASFNDMLIKLKKSQDKITAIERENIGRLLVHQVKNSLTPINLCAKNILDLSKDIPDMYQSSEIIFEESLRLVSFINQFKSLYKFPDAVRIPLDLNALLKGLWKKYPAVQMKYSKENVTVYADRDLMEQAISNIIKNSLDAVEEKKRLAKKPYVQKVKVTTLLKSKGRPHRPGNPGKPGKPQLIVEDNGIGMTEIEQACIFDEFFTTKQKGMGIGLTFVKKVLDVHRFSYSIDSKRDSGTKITLFLYPSS
jgi:nitrogen fixation/metabolism regulation signal transduction histidine kinase